MLSRITSSLLVAFAMAVALLSAGSAQAQSYSPYPDGSILIDSVSGSHYLIAGGAKFWIPSSEQPYFNSTYFTFFVPTSTLDGITNSPQDGTTVRERDTAPVYMILGHQKWHVPSEAELQYFGGWNSVRTIPQGSLNDFYLFSVPVNGLMVRERTKEDVYVTFGGAKFWLPTESDVLYYGGWENVHIVPDGSTSALRTNPGCATRLRERSSGLIYLMSIGGKYLIQNPDSFDWANHFVVPDGSLNAFPTVTTHVCLT